MVSKTSSSWQAKTLLVILILAIGGSSYFLYTFSQKITEQNDIIQNLEASLSNKSLTIENLREEIDRLNLDTKTKESLIRYLGDRLQLSEIEVQELTPVIKRYYAAAVREDGSGSIIPFEIKLLKGTGAVSVNIKNVAPLTGVQDSIRIAADVAESFTNVDMSKKDIDVTFINEGSGIVVVDGPSAGAAMTVAIIAGLQNKTIDEKIFMTGTINSDGTAGPVGGIQQKATAARDFGARIFLVPEGQKSAVTGIEVAEYSNIASIVSLVLK